MIGQTIWATYLCTRHTEVEVLKNEVLKKIYLITIPVIFEHFTISMTYNEYNFYIEFYAVNVLNVNKKFDNFDILKLYSIDKINKIIEL